jgi:hypothetical protein
MLSAQGEELAEKKWLRSTEGVAILYQWLERRLVERR